MQKFSGGCCYERRAGVAREGRVSVPLWQRLKGKARLSGWLFPTRVLWHRACECVCECECVCVCVCARARACAPGLDVARTPACVCGKEVNPSRARVASTPTSPPRSSAPPPPPFLAPPFPALRKRGLCELPRQTLGQPGWKLLSVRWRGGLTGAGGARGAARGRAERNLGPGGPQTGGEEAAGRRDEDRGLAGSARSE